MEEGSQKFKKTSIGILGQKKKSGYSLKISAMGTKERYADNRVNK